MDGRDTGEPLRTVLFRILRSFCVQGMISLVLRHGSYPGEMQPRGGARISNMYSIIMSYNEQVTNKLISQPKLAST